MTVVVGAFNKGTVLLRKGSLTALIWIRLVRCCVQALLVHNLVLLACLLLAIANTDSEEILGLAIVINTASVILDIVILCVFYPR